MRRVFNLFFWKGELKENLKDLRVFSVIFNSILKRCEIWKQDFSQKYFLLTNWFLSGVSVNKLKFQTHLERKKEIQS